MTTLGAYLKDGYWPEFGTLTVRDTWGDYEESGLFDQYATDAQPCGTIVRTGYGWLEAGAVGGPHLVRMELHDSAPPEDTAEWEDAVEIPYRSSSGTVGLTYVTGGPGGEHLQLAGPGTYRLRVTRKAIPDPDEDLEEEPEDLWLLRFWPVTEPEPPRWLARSRPAVSSGNAGWGQVFGYCATDLLFAVWAARDEDDGTTIDALERWGEQHARGRAWLDKALPQPVHDEWDLAEVARQVGVPAPASLRGLLTVLVAAGALVLDEDRYRQPAVVPRAQDVLDMPAERKAGLNLQHDRGRFCAFAADLMSVALWGGSRQTLASLAERTLASEVEVGDALGWAERQGLMSIEGSLAGEFVMAVLPKKPSIGVTE